MFVLWTSWEPVRDRRIVSRRTGASGPTTSTRTSTPGRNLATRVARVTPSTIISRPSGSSSTQIAGIPAVEVPNRQLTLQLPRVGPALPCVGKCNVRGSMSRNRDIGRLRIDGVFYHRPHPAANWTRHDPRPPRPAARLPRVRRGASRAPRPRRRPLHREGRHRRRGRQGRVGVPQHARRPRPLALAQRQRRAEPVVELAPDRRAGSPAHPGRAGLRRQVRDHGPVAGLIELSRGHSESKVKSERAVAAWDAKRTAARATGELATSCLPA